MYELTHNDGNSDDNDDDDDQVESDDQVLYTPTTRKQITSKSVCGVCVTIVELMVWIVLPNS